MIQLGLVSLKYIYLIAEYVRVGAFSDVQYTIYSRHKDCTEIFSVAMGDDASTHTVDGRDRNLRRAIHKP
jgi:hypothetical protein